MIKNRTLIVVGAGASRDLGLPLGRDLQALIGELVTSRDSVSSYFWQGVRLAVGNDGSRFDAAKAAALHYTPRMLSAASIDNFLDQHRNEVDVVTAFKCAIVYCIAEAERNSRLSTIHFKNLPDYFSNNADYFMAHLLNMAIRNHQIDNFHRSLSNLSIITFNYDRCIERYLSLWLEFRFGSDCIDLAKHVRMIHVYGDIGEYNHSADSPFVRNGGLPFQNPHFAVRDLVSGVRLFTEAEGEDTKRVIDDEVARASVIIFLGFGFEEQNMRFFGSRIQDKRVFATVKGMSFQNIGHIEGRLSLFCSPNVDAVCVDGTAADLFISNYFPITEAIGTV